MEDILGGLPDMTIELSNDEKSVAKITQTTMCAFSILWNIGNVHYTDS